MARAVPAEIHLADLPQFRQFIESVVSLLGVIASHDVPLPVSIAADRLRRDVAELGGRVIESPPDLED